MNHANMKHDTEAHTNLHACIDACINCHKTCLHMAMTHCLDAGGKNVEAGRLMAGVTFSSDGNWTSFPPHEHQNLLEEAYLYIDMPAPQWGIQMVYTNLHEPELVQVVREGDVVLMPQGYHPNVAAPGGQINFLWMMAANREGEDRQFGVVNVQPEYAAGGSGLEASQK